MTFKGKHSAQNYKALKERLWSQPRSRQVLEKMEKDRVSQTLMEVVAGKLAKGQHGEGEILAAIYGELIRNRDQSAILRQVSELRTIFAGIQQDLLQAVRILHLLREWEAYRLMGYEEWAEFAENELGLSVKVAGLLLLIASQAKEVSFDSIIQLLIKGYRGTSVANEGHLSQTNWRPASGKKAG